jgi:ribosomal-protein-serine acetyltransferase
MFHHAFAEGRSLRPFEPTDADELNAVIDANRAMLAPWMPWAPAQTIDGTREFIAASRRQLADDDGFQAAIVQDGAIVGSIGFHRVDRANGSTSLGYWLARDAQGRGTATLAAAALIDWALRGPWRLHRIEIRAGTANAPSRAIPERLGFTCEGVIRGVEKLGDGWIDHAVFGLLRDEWAGAPATG